MSELSIVDTHWLVTATGTYFHHAALPPDDLLDLVDDGALYNVKFDCGRRAPVAYTPGVLERQSTPRCPRCCKATGLPKGNGTPHNDPECRRLLGMDT